MNSVVNADDVVNSNGNNACTDDSNNTLTSEASFIDMSSPAPKVIGELGEDMGVPQNIDPRQAQATLDRLEEARQYMQNEVMVEAKYEPVRPLCQNKHESCTFWSMIGECDNNPGFMKVHCGPVCRSCEVSGARGNMSCMSIILNFSLILSFVDTDVTCRHTMSYGSRSY
jgi:hypothetical protein